MIKNDHFLVILGQKYDFLKRPIKRRIFTLFWEFFWLDINSKKFKNIIFRLNSTRAFDWCINCHIWIRKKFYSIFTIREDPYQKKSRKFFLTQLWQFIHQSKALVEFSRNMIFLNFFELISSQKNSQNSVKIRLFIGRFKKSYFWSKITKKWSFLIKNELLTVTFECVLAVL